MARDVYLEGGPLDGQIHHRLDAPPVIAVKTPAKSPPVWEMGDPSAKDVVIDIHTEYYLREFIPHRTGCITYFFDADERIRAAVEDDPSAMLESCQPRSTTSASTPR